jgi:hypothetical protein
MWIGSVEALCGYLPKLRRVIIARQAGYPQVGELKKRRKYFARLTAAVGRTAQAKPPKKRLNACWRWIFGPKMAIMLGFA